MSYLLRIDSSASGDASFSRRVADSFTDAWSGEIVRRDLARTPVGHLDAAGITARTTPADRHTPEQKAAAVLQDELAEEFLGASAYLFAVPVYNYSMPSVFKAWLDHIMIVGRTIGLGDATTTAGRPAVIVSARGGGYGPVVPVRPGCAEAGGRRSRAGRPSTGLVAGRDVRAVLVDRRLGSDTRVVLRGRLAVRPAGPAAQAVRPAAEILLPVRDLLPTP
jgi:FMN-dependent NADH-azoreductase